jgi:hypothetical protein
MCTQDFAAWRMLVPRSLVMIHCETTLMCDLLWTPSLKQILCCLWSDQATSVISIGSKGHTTFMCGLIFFDLGSNYSYKFPLCLVGKGEALELFSVEKQLISSQIGDWLSLLLRCRSLFIHSPIFHVFPNLVRSSRMKKRMNNLTKWIFTQMHDLLLANVNSQPLGLPMVLREFA